MKKLSTSEFVDRAVIVHGLKYSYVDTIYEGTSLPLTIHCTTHGPFSQRPNDHLRGQGCPTCGKNAQRTKRKKTTSEFIEDAICIHNNRYSYDEVEYINTHTPVTIICHTHGKFMQKPNLHLSQKCGCPKCGTESHTGRYTAEFFSSPNNKTIPGMFYVIEFYDNGEKFIKIGITTKTVQERYAGKTGVYTMNILAETKTTLFAAFTKEQYLMNNHEKLHHTPRHKFEGHTECFSSSILKFI